MKIVEYLSAGMTEKSQWQFVEIAESNVKPSWSVFRYKGKKNNLQNIAKELNMQAILNGRFDQRGEVMDSLREDTRFKNFLKWMNLPE